MIVQMLKCFVEIFVNLDLLKMQEDAINHVFVVMAVQIQSVNLFILVIIENFFNYIKCYLYFKVTAFKIEETEIRK